MAPVPATALASVSRTSRLATARKATIKAGVQTSRPTRCPTLKATPIAPVATSCPVWTPLVHIFEKYYTIKRYMKNKIEFTFSFFSDCACAAQCCPLWKLENGHFRSQRYVTVIALLSL